MAQKGNDGVGSGDVMGPATNTDSYIPQWDGANSKTLKNGIPTSTFATSAQGTLADNAVPKATYDAHTILYATTDNTPVALTVGEQTIVGRKTGGNIESLAIDSDLSSVSANDDTVPSAKATKAMGDAKALLAGSTSQAFSVSQLELGHASDTTISRVSAGIAAIEGNNIITANRTASDTVVGIVEIATTAETNTGTSATLAVSADGLAGSYAGTKSLSVQVYDGTTDLVVGDGKAYIMVPEALNGMDVIRATARVI
jgi:hypothetical protein